MNNSNDMLNSYQHNDVLRRELDNDPHRYIELLMENAINKLSKAKKCHYTGKSEEKGFLIGRTTAIIDGLRERLDLSIDDGRQFDILYNEMNIALDDCIGDENTDRLEQVINTLIELKGLWAGLADESKKIDYDNKMVKASENEYPTEGIYYMNAKMPANGYAIAC